MARQTHPTDTQIIQLLQTKGWVKSEAKARLKKEVYQLEQVDVEKIKNYSEHFGLGAKQRLIDEILDIRRENLIARLNAITTADLM